MKKFFSISVQQKYLMGVTGLGLALFVLLHMLGNLLIFAGAKSYNLYAEKLESSSLLIVFEAGLLVLFLTHIVLALVLSLKNFLAREKSYARKPTFAKATAWYQKGLIAQGLVILIFVILHLIAFKFGPHYEVTYGEKTVRDLFRLVAEVFQNPLKVIWYIVALFILSFHLFHGLTSSLQSLGLDHPRFSGGIKTLSRAYVVLVTLGYVSLPLYMFFFKGDIF